MNTLIYLPLERYKNRYTEYLSGPDGMFAYGCKQAGTQLVFISKNDDVSTVVNGPVIDYVRRSDFAFYQINELLQMIAKGEITDDSVIYIEDFWQPGMEMLPYACTIKGIRPKVYAFCHAQSVDPYDFTYAMLPWIRRFEQGWAEWLTGIFVADPLLKDWLVEGRVCCHSKIHATGTVFSRDVLMGYKPYSAQRKRTREVCYTSRFDSEKCPDFFFDLAKYTSIRSPKVMFTVLSGAKIPERYYSVASAYGMPMIGEASKTLYLHWLGLASVMLNCGKQDFVGYCQLDALAVGCAPLCPNHLTFPRLFKGQAEHLYKPGNVEDAYEKMIHLLDVQTKQDALQESVVPMMYQAFGSYYEGSVSRMLEVMFDGASY